METVEQLLLSRRTLQRIAEHACAANPAEAVVLRGTWAVTTYSCAVAL
jgi:hypothetical protein